MSEIKNYYYYYYSDHYGFIPVEVEVGKKEDRGGAHDVMTMSQFVRNYQHSDVYMVQNVPTEMFGKYVFVQNTVKILGSSPILLLEGLVLP